MSYRISTQAWRQTPSTTAGVQVRGASPPPRSVAVCSPDGKNSEFFKRSKTTCEASTQTEQSFPVRVYTYETDKKLEWDRNRWDRRRKRAEKPSYKPCEQEHPNMMTFLIARQQHGPPHTAPKGQLASGSDWRGDPVEQPFTVQWGGQQYILNKPQDGDSTIWSLPNCPLKERTKGSVNSYNPSCKWRGGHRVSSS